MQHSPRREHLFLLIGALGVVYGDIGTSPLYAFKECFIGSHAVAASVENVLGILSLFFWSILLVVSFKYLAILMRADNHGEGGIMALVALLTPKGKDLSGSQLRTVLLGLAGASLLYGDGIVTPAISVLSAVEGLEIVTPVFTRFIVPLTVVIIILLFLVQHRGTEKMGSIFGPTMAVWFLAIAAAGLPWIVRQPQVLMALSPHYAVEFFIHNGRHGFLVLSAVVLCITGAEALYADMGHFGVKPIRQAWYRIVFPSLILNYFGQGALLLQQLNQTGVVSTTNPFYELVPQGLLIPMVIIATLATVVASQALISGAFSLTQQSMQLGYLPRFPLVHTSEHTEGQIFIPRVNQFMMIFCIALVLGFGSSSKLAGAYGIAVVSTMTITTILLFSIARRIWNWSMASACALVGFFLLIDLAFLISNMAKVFHGGWVSLLIGAGIFALMSTWRRGRKILSKEMFNKSMALEQFIKTVEHEKPFRVKGVAVFMTPTMNVAPAVMLHHFKHNQILHERVVLLTIMTRHIPWVKLTERVRVTDLGQGIFQVVAAYGYMQTPNVFEVFECCAAAGLSTQREQFTYYLGRETLLTTGPSSMIQWRKKLFSFMSRNAQPATSFFGIPPERVMEVGLQLEV